MTGRLNKKQNILCLTLYYSKLNGLIFLFLISRYVIFYKINQTQANADTISNMIVNLLRKVLFVHRLYRHYEPGVKDFNSHNAVMRLQKIDVIQT